MSVRPINPWPAFHALTVLLAAEALVAVVIFASIFAITLGIVP